MSSTPSKEGSLSQASPDINNIVDNPTETVSAEKLPENQVKSNVNFFCVWVRHSV